MYPFGLRFDSSNADPFLAWSHGFQLAALNTQGHDRPCWIARALFDLNGGCGYVKKPQFLLPGSKMTNEEIASMLPNLSLTVNFLFYIYLTS
jgi:phosphatidylinositol phospholipase C delta